MSQNKPPAFFISGAPCLDFLNTLATPVEEPIDWIDDGAGLLSWVVQANLVPPEVLRSLKARAMPGEFDVIAAQARHFREWLRGFIAARKGRNLRAEDLPELAPLNRLLGRDDGFLEIAVSSENQGLALGLRKLRRWRSPESLLLPIGEEVAGFLCSDDLQHVKACDGAACTLLFVDRTRGRARRWCSMAICGNRAKQSLHRDRRAQGG